MIDRVFLLVLSCAFAGCVYPGVIRYDVDPALLPDDVHARLQEQYPRYQIESASVRVVQGRSPSYDVALVSGSGRRQTASTTARRVLFPGRLEIRSQAAARMPDTSSRRRGR